MGYKPLFIINPLKFLSVIYQFQEWYNFTPRVSYKTLDAEEAEERFAERGKILNHWSMMVNKKLKSDQDLDGDDLDGDSSGKKSKKDQKATKSLKISDMDDWADSEDGMDSDEDGPNKGSDDDGGRKKGKGKDSRQKKKKSKEDVEDEMDDKFEDSDDGDGEDREVDYITDESSEDEEENPEYDQKGKKLICNVLQTGAKFMKYEMLKLLWI